MNCQQTNFCEAKRSLRILEDNEGKVQWNSTINNFRQLGSCLQCKNLQINEQWVGKGFKQCMALCWVCISLFQCTFRTVACFAFLYFTLKNKAIPQIPFRTQSQISLSDVKVNEWQVRLKHFCLVKFLLERKERTGYSCCKIDRCSKGWKKTLNRQTQTGQDWKLCTSG